MDRAIRIVSPALAVVICIGYAEARRDMVANAAPSCFVTDNNPCSSLSGPFGWGDYRVKLEPKTFVGYKKEIARSASLGQLSPVLAAKVAEIQKACGSRLVSGYRPGARVAGTGRPSCHSAYPSQAADLQGNPSCIYAHLKGWRGGYSTDYAAVAHTHVSVCGRESGSRFAHGGGARHYAKKATRYRVAKTREPVAQPRT